MSLEYSPTDSDCSLIVMEHEPETAATLTLTSVVLHNKMIQGRAGQGRPEQEEVEPMARPNLDGDEG